MKLWSWEINSAASRKVWTFNYVESSELATWKWKRTWKWALKWDWEWERAEENTGGVEMRMGLCFFTAECSTFQFMCSSGAVSYTRVINDGIRRTTWNHFKTNVKNNSKCFPPSSLSIADGYLIVNTLLSGETEMGGGASAWLICDGISLSWWENRKLDVEMLEADGRTDGMNAEYEHQYSGNLESLTRHSCANSWSHSFSSRKRTTCGASYKWQIPTRALAPPLDWPTYYAYSGTWICSGWSVFVTFF